MIPFLLSDLNCFDKALLTGVDCSLVNFCLCFIVLYVFLLATSECFCFFNCYTLNLVNVEIMFSSFFYPIMFFSITLTILNFFLPTV